MTQADEQAAVDADVAQATATEGIMASAKLIIDGIQARVAAAVAVVQAANPGIDLTPITNSTAILKTSSDALAASIVANTPAA